MATRQYVGARYVPIFANPTEWNSALSYDALTIVTYQGNSFTSKIPVPAGVEITNTTYWANTGNYNAQVEQYRQEVAQLKSLMCVNVKDYGALGNGTANDASAFQAAINSGAQQIYIPFDNGEQYKISTQLTLNVNEQVLFSNALAQNPEATGQGCIICDIDNAFNITGNNVTIQNVPFKANTARGTLTYTAIYAHNPNMGNLDLWIDGCAFYNFGTIIDADGRGLRYTNNYSSLCGTGVKITYTFNGTGGNEFQQPSTGGRALLVENNRMHTISTGVSIQGGTWIGARIIGNDLDIGYRLLEVINSASLLHSQIMDNYVDFTNSTTMIFSTSGAVEGCTISGNILKGNLEITPNRVPFAHIHVLAEVTSFKNNKIINNTFNTSSNIMVTIYCPISNCIISDNTFVNTSGNTNAAIGIIGGSTDCSICGNSISLSTQAQGAIWASTSTLSGCQINNNVRSSTQIINSTFTPGTKANVIQD